jgi:nucleoside-diphosphate-sugar epimerase
MRVLVIGGSGFIGRHVVGALARAGHSVAVLHRGQTGGDPPPGVEHILRGRDDLAGIGRFDGVIDMILSSAGQARALVAALRGVAPRVVAVSSMDVYRAFSVLHGTEPGPPDPVPLTETSALRTAAPYSRETLALLRQTFAWLDDEYDKVPVERALMDAGDPAATVLRLPMVYGPGDPLHRLHPILKRIEDGRRAILIDAAAAKWRGPRGYVENVAAAIALAAVSERAAGCTYNVAETHALTELAWTESVARSAGWDGRIVVTPAEVTPPHLRLPYNLDQHWSADTTRLRSELGYQEPVPFDEGLARAIRWERANPPARIDPAVFDYAAEDQALARLSARAAG